MPVHVAEMSSEVTATEGDMPLSKEQLEKLVEYVSQRMQEKQCADEQNKAATEIKNSVIDSW